LSLRGTQFNQSPGVCLGGSVVLVESRRVRERRLRPQAGCLVQPPQSSRRTLPRRFGRTAEAGLAWVDQLQGSKKSNRRGTRSTYVYDVKATREKERPR